MFHLLLILALHFDATSEVIAGAGAVGKSPLALLSTGYQISLAADLASIWRSKGELLPKKTISTRFRSIGSNLSPEPNKVKQESK